MKRLWTQIAQESWSPYAAGMLLGLTCILAVVLANRTLSASLPVAELAATALKAAAPRIIEGNPYYFIIPTGLTWEVWLFIGTVLGGFVGALSSKTFKLRWNPDPLWPKIFGPQPWKRWVVGFAGAIIVQFGAGIAGGCTSGLAVSGGMLLAPSAFLFMAGMFASGILVALIVYRGRY